MDTRAASDVDHALAGKILDAQESEQVVLRDTDALFVKMAIDEGLPIAPEGEAS